jgi:hypothetical protein
MKYICVGQPKTGTKTIAEIFRLLMFNVNNNPLCLNANDDFILLDNNIEYYANDNILKCHKNIEMYEAFHDYPYSFNYAYINTKFPDSKFILTLRDCDEWFNSLFNYQSIPGMTNKSLLKKLYGYETILLENKRDIILKYKKYNTNIINYFHNKPNKLLLINLAKDDENIITKKLSIFLKKTIDFKIPHENKQIYNNTKP